MILLSTNFLIMSHAKDDPLGITFDGMSNARQVLSCSMSSILQFFFFFLLGGWQMAPNLCLKK